MEIIASKTTSNTNTQRRVSTIHRHLVASIADTTGKRAIVKKHALVSPPEGLSAIEIEPMSKPSVSNLKPFEMIIKVKAASCNFPDLLQPSNQHNIKPKLPFVVGGEAAGDIVALGAEAAKTFQIGDRVMHWPASGGMQSWVVASSRWVFKIPKQLSYGQAAGLPLAYMTAYTALVYRGQLKANQSVLVLGATGGVGMAATQMAKAIGCKVIAAGGTDAKLKVVQEEFGADHVVNYTTTPRFRDVVKGFTNGKGVDMVYDPVSGDVLMESFKCCNYGAKILIVGFVGAPVSEGVTGAPTHQILAKNLSVIGSGYDLFRRSVVRDGMNAISKWVEEGKINPRVHAALPIEKVKDGLMMLWNRQVIGKVVVVPP
eukprot:g11951.t1